MHLTFCPHSCPAPSLSQYSALNQSLPYSKSKPHNFYKEPPCYLQQCGRITASHLVDIASRPFSCSVPEWKGALGINHSIQGGVPKARGLLRVTHCEVPAFRRISMKLKASGKSSIVLTIYCFVCPNPGGFTSNFCGSPDKILHTAG